MLKIYNTLTRKVEEFRPLNPPLVTMYTCGPTVYDYQHIGHMRRYVGDDILIRALEFNNFRVKQVMNITDVGHLTSDSDTGEDKMEKGAKKFGMSVWDIAKKFEEQFLNSIDLLNIRRPNILMHATDYIKEQIVFIQILEQKGFTYRIEDGIYFDTSKFKTYGKLRGQRSEEFPPKADQPLAEKAGTRIEMVKGKKNLTDFALWKFSPKDFKRQMEWESPWARPGSDEPLARRGIGFPGWHIECSTMAIKGLDTETLDIHTGGIDHIAIHHTNEIAQAETATGKQFVKYWVHHNFLHVDGTKMSKSIGNIYTVEDVVKKGFDPLSLRYLYLQTHYRQEMNFTWDSLEAAQIAYKRLINEVSRFKDPKIGCAEFEEKFLDAINDDLNMPKALAVVWELVKSDFPTSAKAKSLFEFDEVLGLMLSEKRNTVPNEIMRMVKERENLRKQKRYHLADQLRNKLKKLGYAIFDKEEGTEIKKI